MTQEPRTKMAGWRLLLGVGLLSGGMLTHCTADMAQRPVHRQLTLPVAPEVAYHKATVALATMGGRVLSADGHVLQGVALNAMVLTVRIQPAPTGATIDVTGRRLPNQLALWCDDEVHQYLALLQ
jgi:hypothetical protein